MIAKPNASDGHKFDCWIASTQENSNGGLVIIQEIFGVTDQLKNPATDYSKLGYDVAIPALFDHQQPGAEISFDNADPGRDMMLAANLEQSHGRHKRLSQHFDCPLMAPVLGHLGTKDDHVPAEM